MTNSKLYSLAVKHIAENVPADWRDQVLATEGVTLSRQNESPRKMRIEATDAAIEQVREKVGAFCIIEEPIRLEPDSSEKHGRA